MTMYTLCRFTEHGYENHCHYTVYKTGFDESSLNGWFFTAMFDHQMVKQEKLGDHSNLPDVAISWWYHGEKWWNMYVQRDVWSISWHDLALYGCREILPKHHWILGGASETTLNRVGTEGPSFSWDETLGTWDETYNSLGITYGIWIKRVSLMSSRTQLTKYTLLWSDIMANPHE